VRGQRWPTGGARSISWPGSGVAASPPAAGPPLFTLPCPGRVPSPPVRSARGARPWLAVLGTAPAAPRGPAWPPTGVAQASR
jgi:hypothetical protein